MLQGGVAVEPLRVALVGKMRLVDRKIQEERPVLVFSQEREALLDHQVAEEPAGRLDLAAVALEVVPVGTGPVVKMRIIVDAAAHVAERAVEALAQRHGVGRVAEMPFADVSRGVPGGFEHLGDRDLAAGHAGITLDRRCIQRHPRASRVSAGEQPGPRGRAQRRRGVELREPHPAPRQAVEVRGVDVRGAGDVQVGGPLVVGQDDDHVGAGGLGPCRAGRCGQQDDQDG